MGELRENVAANEAKSPSTPQFPMESTEFRQRRDLEQMTQDDRVALQLKRLNQLLDEVLPRNQFYAEKLRDVSRPISSLEQLAKLPLTSKAELQAASERTTELGDSGLARNHTYPLAEYVRFHRTSGTHGLPMIVVDTAADWRWWIDTWQFVLDAAAISSQDRVLMAFSFGPFIGFWSAHDAITHRGAMAIPAGGMSSEARLELLTTTQATAICCTPTYALRLAEVAHSAGVDLRSTAVGRIIVAGEPGGSVPSIRQRIESKWNARVVDHAGATEIGPWGYADAENQGLHIVESEFIAEFQGLDGSPAGEGELSELVLTTLGRPGAPVIRYRTGDLVRPRRPDQGNRHMLLEGGVLGRVDDMMVIRGVNVFPSALEQIIRGFPEVVEYRITATKQREMDALTVEVEDTLNQPQRIANELQLRLGLQVDVRVVDAGSLPRFEAKGQRFIDRR